jgi:hypothetical protein
MKYVRYDIEAMPDNTVEVLRMVADMLGGSGSAKDGVYLEPSGFGLYATADGSSLWLNEADDCLPWIRADVCVTRDPETTKHMSWGTVRDILPAKCFPFKRIDVRLILEPVEAKTKEAE